MKLLVALLRRNVSVWQLLGFGLGGWLGALIVLLSMQAYRDVHRAFSANDALFADNYVVISKPVNLLTTVTGLFGAHSPSFTEREVREIEALANVEKVARFRSAHFAVDGVVRVSGHVLGTEMFLESVPDDFIDLPATDVPWRAALDDRFVPVLVPRSYLDLYNFGYAASRGLPQLAEGAIGQFPFQLVMGGRRYQARIVGFSTRLNTILVPDGFLSEANAAFGSSDSVQSTRLIIRTRNTSSSGDLLDYIARKNYVVADGGDALVRMQTLVYGIVAAVAGIGLLVTGLAFFLLIISILLLVERNRTVFRNLDSMGYTVGEMSRPYRWLAVTLDVAIWTLAVIAASLVYRHIGALVALAAPKIEPAGFGMMLLFAIVGCAVFIVLHFVAIHRAIVRSIR